MRPPNFVFTMAALFFYSALTFAEDLSVSRRRLEWEAVKDVVQYEVRLERLEENQWRQTLRQTVRGRLYIDCELKNGDYRFCVRSFDVIGRPGETSDWIEFSVILIEQPEQTIETPDAESQPKSGAKTPPPEKQPQDARPADARPAADAHPADVRPAGASPIQSDGSVDISKAVWRIGAAAAPFIALPLGAFNDDYSSAIFQPAGFLLSIEALPLRTKTFAFGIQFLPSWNFLTLEKFDTAHSTHIAGLNAAFVWQIKILRASALNIRAGGGCTLFFSHGDFNSGTDTRQKNATNPSLITGVSLRTFFVNALFIDIGADYFLCIASDDVAASFVRPFLTLGWWF